MEDGSIGLIDFGQVKQISGRARETLCKVMIALDEREGDDRPEDLATIGNLAIELGVEINHDAKPEAAAAIAMWLFDGTVENLPGGYDSGELSPNSPVRDLKSFAQDLVLVGRSTILIKALAARQGIKWSLAEQWAPIARDVLYGRNQTQQTAALDSNRVRFSEVWSTVKLWGAGKAKYLGRKLPNFVRSPAASLILKYQERKARRKVTRRQ